VTDLQTCYTKYTDMYIDRIPIVKNITIIDSKQKTVLYSSHLPSQFTQLATYINKKQSYRVFVSVCLDPGLILLKMECWYPIPYHAMYKCVVTVCQDMMVWKSGKLQRYKIEGLCLMLNCSSPCTNPLSLLIYHP
jgi:hypothetical protein